VLAAVSVVVAAAGTLAWAVRRLVEAWRGRPK
jgi:hypothetical protein